MNPLMIIYNIGGSHRQYDRDIASLKSAGIAFKHLGAATLGSKKRSIGVSEESADQMKRLGFSKARKQWDNYAWYDPNAPIPADTPEMVAARALPKLDYSGNYVRIAAESTVPELEYNPARIGRALFASNTSNHVFVQYPAHNGTYHDPAELVIITEAEYEAARAANNAAFEDRLFRHEYPLTAAAIDLCNAIEDLRRYTPPSGNFAQCTEDSPLLEPFTLYFNEQMRALQAALLRIGIAESDCLAVWAYPALIRELSQEPRA